MAHLAPLTLVLGENSTGKTSLLAAMRAICDVAFRQREPNFREPPYDLGAFPEIVHSRGIKESSAETFEIGVRAVASGHGLLGCNATFKSGTAAAPQLSTGHVTGGDLWIEWLNEVEDAIRFEFGSGGEPWGKGISKKQNAADWTTFVSHSYVATHSPQDVDNPLYERNIPDAITNIVSMSQHEELASLISIFQRYLSGFRPFASAPVHPNPRRTYDPTKLDDDPWGADVPSRFASLDYLGKTEWTALKKKLDVFGQESGLFDEISVKQLTKSEGGPFQLQIRKFGKGGRKGPKRNLMDVGFGVSQVLPVLTALFRADGPPMFLLQQPELHLHPSAQAALGSLFCRTAEAGRQLIIETHSEYIIDRVRMDIRDRQTALEPDDVSILFFERSDLDVRIHSLRFDDQGNVLGAPDGYGQFFMDEARRSVGL